jgi:hypothetical protein
MVRVECERAHAKHEDSPEAEAGATLRAEIANDLHLLRVMFEQVHRKT